LLRMIAADNAGVSMPKIANAFTTWFRSANEANFLPPPGCEKSRRRLEANASKVPAQPALPLARFFRLRGLDDSSGVWVSDGRRANEGADQARHLVIDFGYHYGRLVHQPQTF